MRFSTVIYAVSVFGTNWSKKWFSEHQAFHFFKVPPHELPNSNTQCQTKQECVSSLYHTRWCLYILLVLAFLLFFFVFFFRQIVRFVRSQKIQILVCVVAIDLVQKCPNSSYPRDFSAFRRFSIFGRINRYRSQQV